MRELLWRHVVILLHQRAIARHRHHTASLAASTPVAPFRLRGPSRHHRRIVAADSRRQIHTFERLAACWLVVRSPMRTRARPTLQSSPPDVRLCTHCLSQMRATSRRPQITLAHRIPAASTRWLARCTTAPRGSATSRAMAPARRAWKRSRQASLRAVQRRRLRWRQFLGMQATCRAIISEPSGHRIGGAPPLRQLGTRPPGSQCPASRCTTSSSTLRRGQCGHGSGRRGRGSPRVCHAWPIWHCAPKDVNESRKVKAESRKRRAGKGATVEGNAVCERGSRVDRQTRQKRRMYSILAAAVNTQQ